MVLTALRLYLAANLAVFAGFTLGFFAAPARLAGLLDITLGSTTALADFRAMYGGMCLGVGVLFVAGLVRPAWRAPAVLLAITTAAGLLLGRLLTVATAGPAGPFIYGSMAGEIGSVVAGAWLLARPEIRAPSQAATAASFRERPSAA